MILFSFIYLLFYRIQDLKRQIDGLKNELSNSTEIEDIQVRYQLSMPGVVYLALTSILQSNLIITPKDL